jgi:lysozyme
MKTPTLLHLTPLLCAASTLAASATAACDYACSSGSASSYLFGSNGLDLLTAFEGFSSTCYLDTEGVWTIGYGHACQSSASDLPEYGVSCTAGSCSGSLTEAQARSVLANDISNFVSCVQKATTTSVTQNQFDALVSFAYNVGCSAYQSSTLLAKLNGGTLTDEEAQYQFTRWHSGCTAGLERRRFTESQLFSTCSTSFGCSSSNCQLSYSYPECSGTCQYCDACGGCSGSSFAFSGCVEGGGGGGCDSACTACIEGGGGKACADGACAGCSADCTNCIVNGGGKACEDRCWGATAST